MRLFLYEHTCAVRGAPAALVAEGRAMYAALDADLRRLPGVEIVTLDAVAPADEEPRFRALARASDRVLVIAPEFGDILYHRCRWVEEEGGFLLGPSVAAVRLTADKERQARHLRAHGVPTPPCDATTFPAVLKPRDGAGSLATFLVHSSEELSAAREQAAAEGWRGELIVQPFVSGTAASVAFLVGPRGAVALLPAEQLLSADGRFHYLGGRIPLAPDLATRAERVARRAVEAVEGLRGYVGVDVVLGEQDWVIEINPRVTTSYVGLRTLAEANLAEALLRVALGEAVSLTWKAGEVVFSPTSSWLASSS